MDETVTTVLLYSIMVSHELCVFHEVLVTDNTVTIVTQFLLYDV